MGRAISGIVLILGLGGCASGLPLEEEVIVDGQRFVAAQGVADVVIRAYLPNAAGEFGEIAGATCAVSTSLYDARVTTPARLVVPNFGAQSPDLDITCEALDKIGSAQQPIRTYWQSAPGYYGGVGWGRGYGLYGPGWGGYGPQPSYPVSRYPEVAVVLR